MYAAGARALQLAATDSDTHLLILGEGGIFCADGNLRRASGEPEECGLSSGGYVGRVPRVDPRHQALS